jgi:hypothetical protein
MLLHKSHRLAANWEYFIWWLKFLNCSMLKSSDFNICSLFVCYYGHLCNEQHGIIFYRPWRHSHQPASLHSPEKFRLCDPEWMLFHVAEHRLWRQQWNTEQVDPSIISQRSGINCSVTGKSHTDLWQAVGCNASWTGSTDVSEVH